jgi:4-diphosphocytidyl-2-C-methyl-D-erythritol kinase
VSDAQRRLMPVVRLAPAKLNLTLAVVGHRPDGYHALHSVMVPIGLHDRLSLAPSGGNHDSLHVEGFDPGPPAENLVLRAVAAARAAAEGAARGAGGSTPPLAIRLEKRIPVAAGLAGGSSDAAAAIDGALEAWGVELPAERRRALAAGLGSDVPFFLAGGAALVEGRGERVRPLRGILGVPPGVLLVTPSAAVGTATVFAAFAAGGRGAGGGSARLASEHLAAELDAGLRTQDLLARAGVLAAANDLAAAAAAVLPALVAFRRRLLRVLGRPVGLSGSGPTLWALYPSLDDARAAERALRIALDAGELPTIGDGPPFVAATTVEAAPPAEDRRNEA